jgi:ribosomal protein S20
MTTSARRRIQSTVRRSAIRAAAKRLRVRPASKALYIAVDAPGDIPILMRSKSLLQKAASREVVGI